MVACNRVERVATCMCCGRQPVCELAVICVSVVSQPGIGCQFESCCKECSSLSVCLAKLSTIWVELSMDLYKVE